MKTGVFYICETIADANMVLSMFSHEGTKWKDGRDIRDDIAWRAYDAVAFINRGKGLEFCNACDVANYSEYAIVGAEDVLRGVEERTYIVSYDVGCGSSSNHEGRVFSVLQENHLDYFGVVGSARRRYISIDSGGFAFWSDAPRAKVVEAKDIVENTRLWGVKNSNKLAYISYVTDTSEGVVARCITYELRDDGGIASDNTMLLRPTDIEARDIPDFGSNGIQDGDYVYDEGIIRRVKTVQKGFASFEDGCVAKPAFVLTKIKTPLPSECGDVLAGDLVVDGAMRTYSVLHKNDHGITLEGEDCYGRFIITAEEWKERHFSKVEKTAESKWRHHNTTIEATQRIKDDICQAFSDANYDTREKSISDIAQVWAARKSALADVLRKDKDWDEKNMCVRTTVKISEKDAASACEKLMWLADRFDDFYGVRKVINISQTSLESNSLSEEDCSYLVRAIGEKPYLRKGKRLSRVVNSLMCDLIPKEVRDGRGYETRFAAFSDAVGAGDREVPFVLSINPVDFLRMSYGNTWHSCHYLDAEDTDHCYQGGAMSYMLDTVSMVAYVPDGDSDTPQFADKVYRQMYFFNGHELIKSRLYPNYDKDKTIGKQFFAKVCEILGVENGKKFDIDSGNMPITMKAGFGSLAYPDWTYSEYHAQSIRVDVQPGAIYLTKDEIGTEIICPCCGAPHHFESNSCYCADCYYDDERSDYDYDRQYEEEDDYDEEY